MSNAGQPQAPEEVRAYLHERGYDIVMRGPEQISTPARRSYRPRRHISYYETYCLTGNARLRRRRTWLRKLIRKGG